MKKILDVLDPRRSKPRLSGTLNSAGIIVEGHNEVFSLQQLQQAIKCAAALESKGDQPAKIFLPCESIPVKGNISLTGNIVLIGQTAENDEKEVSVSRLVMESGSAFQCKAGSNYTFQSLVINSSKRFKSKSYPFSLNAGSRLTMLECVLQTDDEATEEITGFYTEGSLVIKGCLLTSWRIESNLEGNISLESSHFVTAFEPKRAMETAAISLFSIETKNTILKSEFKGYSVGIHIPAADKGSIIVEIEETSIAAIQDGIIASRGELDVQKCEFVATKGCGLRCNGNVSLKDTQSIFKDSAVGFAAFERAEGSLNGSKMRDNSVAGVQMEGVVKFELVDVEATTNKSGIDLSRGAVVSSKNCIITGSEQMSILLRDEGTVLSGLGLNIESSPKGIQIEDMALFDAANVIFDKIHGIGMELNYGHCNVRSFKFENGDSCVVAEKATVDLYDGKILDTKSKSICLKDSSGILDTVNVINKNSKQIGIFIQFDKSDREKLTLRDCKLLHCSAGVKIEQIHSDLEVQNEILKKDIDEYEKTFITADENYTMGSLGGSSRKNRVSKVDLENCSFIMSDIGFHIDAAKATLKGCSFVMSHTHSIFMKNQLLRQGTRVRKSTKLRVRWPNFVEPYIDNGSALSNDPQMLTTVTQEKGFCGSADFEPVMYLPTLTERIKQARNVFRSREENSEMKARVIMRSVGHMLVLLKTLMDRLLNKELLEDPDLGMFAATFKLYDQPRKGQHNNLVVMTDLLDSWRHLSKTKLFDDALMALNESFERKQIDEDMFDETVTPLEDLQRVCYVNSKFTRRREYLLSVAQENPLAAWYFLDKEDPSTNDGRRLREEVLKFLAADDEERRVHNKANFHASWVAQWAVKLLGDSFTSGRIPDHLTLRRAWADKLLDEGKAKRVLDEYKSRGAASAFNTQIDQLLKFEAMRMYEAQGNALTPDDYKRLSDLLEGAGYPQAMKHAATLFKGEGTLPGFLRREAAKAANPEMLLEVLSHVHEDQTIPNGTLKKQVILAVMSQYFYPDSMDEPVIPKTKASGYDTCPSCLVQKLQPWNELCLSGCKDSHRFCRNCLKTSMSTGALEMWGKCPGITSGKPCQAIATRREMELAGMEKTKIYNILNSRVVKQLQSITGWKQCDSPGCIGGRSGVTKDYYTCWLCTKMVTKDGGKTDPTVAIRLLKGLDGTQIARGEGVFRECYHCAVIYEKGNACSTIHCQACNQEFSMTWGPENISHRFDEEGVGPQRYVPKKEGKLWELGVFKDKKGNQLALGQTLSDAQTLEVVRRANLLIAKLNG